MKHLNAILTLFLSTLWLTIFSISAFWLCEGKYTIASYTIIGMSLVVGFILWAAEIYKNKI